MSTLFMLTGVSGSGKSMYSKFFAEAYKANIVSSDNIRYIKYGANFSSSDTQDVYDTLERIVIDALKSGQNVIIDSPMLAKRDRKHFIDVFRPFANEIVSIFIDTPKDVCLKRNSVKRSDWVFDRPVPAEYIEKSFARLETPLLNEGFDKCIRISYSECV